MHIVMVGVGYVGLVSGVCFSDLGHHVICVDNDPSKLVQLEKGEVPIYEPGLNEVLLRNVGEGRLSFTGNLAEALKNADAVFIAVGTPTRSQDWHTDLSYVFAAAEEIAKSAKRYIVIVTKATVPVGTNRKIEQLLAKTNPALDFDVVSNPEFLREGSAVNDFMRPDRVVVGVQSERAAEMMEQIYSPHASMDFPIIVTDLESAEMIKYASNAFLATKITFINEIAALCERIGGDVRDVAKGIGLDSRIGSKFLHAGPGYGGSCFPKDARALAATGWDNKFPMRITETVVEVNEQIKLRMIDKMRTLCDGDLRGKIVAILGVTFKPDTDDMREAPSLTIVPALISAGSEVRVVDPQGRHHGEALLLGVNWVESPYDAAQDADLVVILTEWNVFRHLNLQRLAQVMATPRLADLRNIYTADQAFGAGFERYDAVGYRIQHRAKLS